MVLLYFGADAKLTPNVIQIYIFCTTAKDWCNNGATMVQQWCNLDAIKVLAGTNDVQIFSCVRKRDQIIYDSMA